MKQQLVDIHTHHPTEATTIRTVGVHPWQAAAATLPDAEAVRAAEAVGEIGLDKVCSVDFEAQKTVFEAQLKLAEQQAKPVVLHCVKAFNEMMQCLAGRSLPAVIFHGFIGSKEQAQQALLRGYYLSFGARTATSPKTIEALRQTPLDRLFVESDEATTPLGELYAEIASLRGITSEELQAVTRANYRRIFKKNDG
ncbi:MAG: TatD family hydrolase [Alistipes sp.]|nr:TatD family hydrolase [Alistipes sp.]